MLGHDTLQSSAYNLCVETKIVKIGSVVPEKNGRKNAHFETKTQLFYRLVDFHRTKSDLQNLPKDLTCRVIWTFQPYYGVGVASLISKIIFAFFETWKKSLQTIMASVTHNGKQFMLTVGLLTVVIYLYTVLAFNFFKGDYNKGEDGEDDYKCNDMLSCFQAWFFTS